MWGNLARPVRWHTAVTIAQGAEVPAKVISEQLGQARVCLQPRHLEVCMSRHSVELRDDIGDLVIPSLERKGGQHLPVEGGGRTRVQIKTGAGVFKESTKPATVV
jgi:hypothetical protein